MQTGYHGSLFMVVAPSGAGKSSLIQSLLKEDSDLQLSISYTTRPARPTEKDGKEYNFISREEFSERNLSGEFLEWAQVHGNLYATSAAWITKKMLEGQDILTEIDWQGAQQMRAHFKNAIEIFILPPSIERLEERLRLRAQDKNEVISQRLLAASAEMAHALEADFIIVNENFFEALQQLRAIISAMRLRLNVQRTKYKKLFDNLKINH